MNELGITPRELEILGVLSPAAIGIERACYTCAQNE